MQLEAEIKKNARFLFDFPLFYFSAEAQNIYLTSNIRDQKYF